MQCCCKKTTSISPALVCALKGIERCFSFRPLLQVAFSYCMIVRRTCSISLIVIRRFRTVFHLILVFFFIYVLLSFILFLSATFYFLLKHLVWNKVRFVVCSVFLSTFPHKYTYVSIRIQDCGTVNSLSGFLYFNIRLYKIYRRCILLEFFLREFIFLFSSKYYFDSVLVITSFCSMSNKRDRAVLEEDDNIVDEYEYPYSAYDEEPTQVDHSFYLRVENVSSHGLPENDGSSSMAPGSSSSSSALSSNVFNANDRSVFIDGVEH